MEFNLFDIA
jgi:hypothetical protein